MEFNDVLLLELFFFLFSFARFLTIMVETHWLLIYCLRPWFGIRW